MSQQAPNRLQRRKARTRGALIAAARNLIAAGRLDVPILELTQAADVGMGSFYNHFDSKDELFRVAVEEALSAYGETLEQLGLALDDPATRFAMGFRLTGRLHRRNPELSKILLHHGVSLAGPVKGLTALALIDIEAAIASGRFNVADPELALVVTTGAAVTLGQLLHDKPERDDAEATDQITEDLLRMMGMPADEARALARGPLPDIAEVERDALGLADAQLAERRARTSRLSSPPRIRPRT